MLTPAEEDAAPKSRTLEEVGSTFSTEARAGVVRLLYWDPSETEFRFSVSGPYRFGLISLNGETIQVGQRVVIWMESNDDMALELVDSLDLANAGGLSGPHRIAGNFAVLRATTAKTSPGYVVRASGERGTITEPFQLRYIIHGAWLVSSDANDAGIEALKAAVQSAVDAEAFPPEYSETRVWSPGEYFHLSNAVYLTVSHTIGVSRDDVDGSPHFSKVFDGAASRSDDIDARVAAEAEEGNTDPWPVNKIPTIPASKVSGLPSAPQIPNLGISGRTNSTLDLFHGSQTITLPGASPTEAGLLRGQEQAKLTGLVRNRWVGNVASGLNFLEGDVCYQIDGRRYVLARCRRDHQTSNGRRPLDLAFSGGTYWQIVFDITLPAVPSVPTTAAIVSAIAALTGDARLSYTALRDTPDPGDPGTLYMYQRHDGRIAYGFGGESSVQSDADGTVITDTDSIPLTVFHNRHDWVQGVTVLPGEPGTPPLDPIHLPRRTRLHRVERPGDGRRSGDHLGSLVEPGAQG